MNQQLDEYIAALENALCAAIVTLYSTHQQDCIETFTHQELVAVLEHTQDLAPDVELEQLYAIALRHECAKKLLK